MPSVEDGISSARQKAQGFNMILVTGGSGYIGSHTVLELLLAGYGAVVVDNLSNSHWEALVRVHWIAQQDFIKRGLSNDQVPPLFFHQIDICDKGSLQTVFETWKTDEFELPKRFTLSHDIDQRQIKRSIPKDIGPIASRQKYQCKDFSFSKEASKPLNENVEGLRIHFVIHFAALKSVSQSVAEPLAYYRNNVAGLLNILELMSEYKVKNIVFSSSATVYGTGKETNITEDSVEVGGKGAGAGLLTNPYGRSKWMSEEILNDCSISDPELDVIALRYFNPTGSHPSGLIGEDPKGVPNNIIPVVLQAFQRRRSKVYVFGSNYDTPDGTGVRDYIHVIDLARGHVAAIRKLSGSPKASSIPLASASPTTVTFQKQSKIDTSSNASSEDEITEQRRNSVFTPTRPNYRCYNLGTGQGHSVLEILSAFSTVCGKDIPFVIGDARTGDLGTVTADVSKATTELGWYAEFGLQDMCRDVYQWALDNPQGYERLRRLSMMAQVDPTAVLQVMETVDEDTIVDEKNYGSSTLSSARSSRDFSEFIRRISILSVDDSKYKSAVRRASEIHEGLGAMMGEEQSRDDPKKPRTMSSFFSDPFETISLEPMNKPFSNNFPEWNFDDGNTDKRNVGTVGF